MLKDADITVKEDVRWDRDFEIDRPWHTIEKRLRGEQTWDIPLATHLWLQTSSDLR